MKNNTLSGRYCFKNPRFKQIFRIMRISTFLLMVCVFCSYAGNAHSQNAKVSIRMNNVKLDKILNEIENQTDYLFIYNNQVDINKITSVKVKNEAVAQVLDRILSGTGINYELEGTHIILTTEAIKDLHAQQQAKTVTGTVTDVSGEPIIGANIRIKGTTTGTITDIDGNFSIKAEPQSVIEVSYIGYLTQETVINNQKSIRFLLKEDTKTLDEVVVIGYGVQKKADLTGSVANINTEKLNTQSNANIGQALQGKIAGVDIVSQGGAPGSGTRIMVRGIGTLNNASPLYIVDGMYMNSIDHINPNDIASIDVLKDASSAAIYGSRAGHGVIIVTTKRGKEQKAQVRYSGNVSVQTMKNGYKALNGPEYMEYYNRFTYEDYLMTNGLGIYENYVDLGAGHEAPEYHPTYSPDQIANAQNTDWFDEVSRTGMMHSHNVSVNGGSKTTQYMASLGYMGQSGVVKNNNMDRVTAKINLDQTLSKYAKAGISLNISRNSLDNVPLGTGTFENAGILSSAAMFNPTLPVYDENGKYSVNPYFTQLPNPVSLLEITDKTTKDRILASAYLQIEPVKGLILKANFGIDRQYEKRKQYLPKTTMYGEPTDRPVSLSPTTMTT